MPFGTDAASEGLNLQRLGLLCRRLQSDTFSPVDSGRPTDWVHGEGNRTRQSPRVPSSKSTIQNSDLLASLNLLETRIMNTNRKASSKTGLGDNVDEFYALAFEEAHGAGVGGV